MNLNELHIQKGEGFTIRELKVKLDKMKINYDPEGKKKLLADLYDEAIKLEENKLKILDDLIRDTQLQNKIYDKRVLNRRFDDDIDDFMIPTEMKLDGNKSVCTTITLNQSKEEPIQCFKNLIPSKNEFLTQKISSNNNLTTVKNPENHLSNINYHYNNANTIADKNALNHDKIKNAIVLNNQDARNKNTISRQQLNDTQACNNTGNNELKNFTFKPYDSAIKEEVNIDNKNLSEILNNQAKNQLFQNEEKIESNNPIVPNTETQNQKSDKVIFKDPFIDTMSHNYYKSNRHTIYDFKNTSENKNKDDFSSNVAAINKVENQSSSMNQNKLNENKASEIAAKAGELKRPSFNNLPFLNEEIGQNKEIHKIENSNVKRNSNININKVNPNPNLIDMDSITDKKQHFNHFDNNNMSNANPYLRDMNQLNDCIYNIPNPTYPDNRNNFFINNNVLSNDFNNNDYLNNQNNKTMTNKKELFGYNNNNNNKMQNDLQFDNSNFLNNQNHFYMNTSNNAYQDNKNNIRSTVNNHAFYLESNDPKGFEAKQPEMNENRNKFNNQMNNPSDEYTNQQNNILSGRQQNFINSRYINNKNFDQIRFGNNMNHINNIIPDYIDDFGNVKAQPLNNPNLYSQRNNYINNTNDTNELNMNSKPFDSIIDVKYSNNKLINVNSNNDKISNKKENNDSDKEIGLDNEEHINHENNSNSRNHPKINNINNYIYNDYRNIFFLVLFTVSAFFSMFYFYRSQNISIGSYTNWLSSVGDLLSTINRENISNVFNSFIESSLSIIGDILQRIFSNARESIWNHIYFIIFAIIFIFIIRYLYLQYYYKKTSHEIYELIKNRLRNIRRLNPSDFRAGLRVDDIVAEFTQTYNFTENNFRLIILPLLKILRSKDHEVKSFAEQSNGKVFEKWQYKGN